MSDLISRQAALDIVFDFAEAPHNMYQKIRELPSAEKHGFWGGAYDVENDLWEYTCTECGWQLKGDETFKGYNFCPNCGARMDG